MIDQEYAPTANNTGYGVRSRTYHRGQSFTAGVSSQLSAVALWVRKCAAGNTSPLEIEIHEGSLPTSSVLGTATIPAASIPFTNGCFQGTVPPSMFIKASLAAPVPITAGTVYSIWAISQNQSDEYGWSGDGPGSYGGGEGFTFTSTGSHPGNLDLGFRTYVESPPALPWWLWLLLLLVLLLLLALILRRRRRQRR